MPADREQERVAGLATPLFPGVLYAVLAVITPASPAFGQPLDIAVDPFQIATVSGRSESLRSVIEELCEAAEVQLLAYDAEDRPLIAGYENLPLHELLPRLLKKESYFVGLQANETDGETRVATLRVIGQSRSDPAASPPANALRQALNSRTEDRTPLAFQIPPALLRSSFNSENEQTRERAAKYIKERLLGNIGQTQRFISIDAESIGVMLKPYKYASDILKQVRDQHDDPAVQIQIDTIVRAIERG
jgi:hypothetical protein